MRPERTSKPYSRPGKSNPDGPGSWKHDLHQSPSGSLADRISGNPRNGQASSSRPSLLSRISGGQGKELPPAGAGKVNGNGNSSNRGKELFGFGSTPPINPTTPNAGVELLGGRGSGASNGGGPARTPRGFQTQPGQRSLAQFGVNAALGLGLDEHTRRDRREGRELMGGSGQRREEPSSPGVSILGAGRTTLLVRVANLAQGTTSEDVVSAFAPMQFLNASVSSSSTSSLVSVDLEVSSSADANDLIGKYNGQIADGNKLNVSIIKPAGGGLASRMSQAQSQAQYQSKPAPAQARGQELLAPSSGKMYSDTVLQSDPRARIQTLSEQREEEARNRDRASAWGRSAPVSISTSAQRSGGSLASRLGGGGGGYRGRGQSGGGMMVD